MKILFLAGKIPYPAVDGGTLATYHLLRGLYDAGTEITFFSLNTKKHLTDVSKMQEHFPLMQIMQFEEDLSIRPFDALMNLFSGESYNIMRFYKKHVNQALEKLLTAETFDLVHIESLFMVPYLGTIRRLSKARVVLRSHNVEHRIWQNLADNTTNPLKKWYLNTLANRLMDYEHAHLNEFDHLLAISSSDAEEFRNMGCVIPLSILHSGFDFGRLQKYMGLKKSWDFFHIGSMDWLPNVEAMKWFLKSIWPHVHKKYPHVRFHLAGRKMPKDFEDMHVPCLKVDGEVDDAYRYMAHHGVMVVPLLSGSGLRIKLIEAMAMGNTIIATPLAASGLGAVDGEHIMIAKTEEDFQVCMKLCMDDPERAKQMGVRAAAFARQHFDNEKLAAGLLELYKKLVSE